MVKRILLTAILIFISNSSIASAIYWNLFNDTTSNTSVPSYVTYSTLEDMLTDTNRVDIFSPDGYGSNVANNLVATGSDGTHFWNFFNNLSTATSIPSFSTYSDINGMLNDTNRTGFYEPTGYSVEIANNIIATGSDGTTYWNLFNNLSNPNGIPVYATYASLMDMLADTNRIDIFSPTGYSADIANNIVASGSDGQFYWSLFNDLSSSGVPSYVTYATLDDMLKDENRLNLYEPIGYGLDIANRIIGSGAFVSNATNVNAPYTLPVLALLLFALTLQTKQKRPHK
ncbi:hypothetical protein [Glaciecola sp. 1036]|uniref:hypothetical protein n=1 Tax=Alteromonadaceae TaxID=72275 RepID=UPI003CFDFF00